MEGLWEVIDVRKKEILEGRPLCSRISAKSPLWNFSLLGFVLILFCSFSALVLLCSALRSRPLAPGSGSNAAWSGPLAWPRRIKHGGPRQGWAVWIWRGGGKSSPCSLWRKCSRVVSSRRSHALSSRRGKWALGSTIDR